MSFRDIIIMLFTTDSKLCLLQHKWIEWHYSELPSLINMSVMLTESGCRDVPFLFPCLSKQHLLLSPLSLFPNVSVRLLNVCTMEGNGLPLMHAITSRPAVIDAKGRQIYSNLSSTVPVHSLYPPRLSLSTRGTNCLALLFVVLLCFMC